MERIQKIMAHAGIASRRKCEEIIAQGRVSVNGKTAKLGDKADISKEEITVDDKRIEAEKKKYIIFNKPAGFVTTVSEKHGMRTVMHIVRTKERVFPVGRLDRYTEGLLLLTNDGDFANKLTHPRFEIKKTYVALLDKDFDSKERQAVIDGRKAAFEIKAEGKKAEITIHEGRKHIVRRIFEKLGYKVTRLKRTAIGGLKLGKLAKGTWRELRKDELSLFFDKG